MKTTGIEIDIGIMNGVMAVCPPLSIVQILPVFQASTLLQTTDEESDDLLTLSDVLPR